MFLPSWNCFEIKEFKQKYTWLWPLSNIHQFIFFKFKFYHYVVQLLRLLWTFLFLYFSYRFFIELLYAKKATTDTKYLSFQLYNLCKKSNLHLTFIYINMKSRKLLKNSIFYLLKYAFIIKSYRKLFKAIINKMPFTVLSCNLSQTSISTKYIKFI